MVVDGDWYIRIHPDADDYGQRLRRSDMALIDWESMKNEGQIEILRGEA